MANKRRDYACWFCGANITDPMDDWAIRLVRTEPREAVFGDLKAMETGHHAHGTWHLCKRCSEIAMLAVERKMDTFRSEVNL